MPGPYVRPEALHQAIADAIHTPVDQLPAEWLRGAADAVTDGYLDVLAECTNKGYSIDVLDQSDQRQSLNRRRALVILARRLAGYGDFSFKSWEADDPLPMLKDHPQPLTIAGVPQAPTNSGSEVGTYGYGTLDAFAAEDALYRRRFSR